MMEFIKRNGKRILTDAAGYGLIILAILTGWLPGPGGIPLALAGLGLLSINNAWARTARNWLLYNSGRVAKFLFPPDPFVQICYDLLTLFLLVFVVILSVTHHAVWKLSLAIIMFCLAALFALMNRSRLERWRNRRNKHKQQ
jgi:hypothetical protein